jgi:mono/diheme cytochrome c family protein
MRAFTRIQAGLAVGTALALGACDPAGYATNSTASSSAAQPVPGGAVRSGATIATMADQYNRAHPGPPASGASSWVPAPPPPAYVDTSPPPPPAPPPPPLAAVANRQPGQAAAGEVPRPEAQSGAPELQAAAPAPAPAARRPTLAAADLAKGRKLFGDNGCGGCHTLADAGAAGVVGPGFDGNAGLTADIAYQTIHDGRGAMPSFGGVISDADIRLLSNYIVAVKK